MGKWMGHATRLQEYHMQNQSLLHSIIYRQIPNFNISYPTLINTLIRYRVFLLHIVILNVYYYLLLPQIFFDFATSLPNFRSILSLFFHTITLVITIHTIQPQKYINNYYLSLKSTKHDHWLGRVEPNFAEKLMFKPVKLCRAFWANVGFFMSNSSFGLKIHILQC